ncbi:MAG: ADP-heptose:LPS heptosyltransferase [Saprospiraceae bacterium]
MQFVVRHFLLLMIKKYNKILIVRFSSIGDIVLTSPVVRCVKKQLGSDVHFITKAKFRPTIEHNPHIDKIYTIDKEVTEILPKLKDEKYDLIIDLHKNLRSKRLILSLGVKSISFDKINIEKWLRVHTRLNFLPKTHLIDRYFESLESIGVTNDGQGLSYHHGLTEYDIADLMPSDRYVAIVLGATYHTKRIPKEKLEIIIQNSKLKCVLLGGNDVKEQAEELKAKYPQVLNLCGQVSLNESAALVLSSKYTITGDTGLMHIAAAFKTPTMVFWGSTAYELGMYPYYGNKYDIPQVHMINKDINCSPCSKIGKDVCPKSHFKCMMDLSKEDIIQGIRTLEK